MYDEREVLVRHVFPEIRRRCFERGVGFVEVDLRWGITKEQVELGFAVPICFQQIDNCQPFFIGKPSLKNPYFIFAHKTTPTRYQFQSVKTISKPIPSKVPNSKN